MHFDAIHDKARAHADKQILAHYTLGSLSLDSASWDMAVALWTRAYTRVFELFYGIDERATHAHLSDPKNGWLCRRNMALLVHTNGAFKMLLDPDDLDRRIRYYFLMLMDVQAHVRRPCLAWAIRFFPGRERRCAITYARKMTPQSILTEFGDAVGPSYVHRALRVSGQMAREGAQRKRVRARTCYDLSNVAKAIEDGLARTTHNNGGEAHQLQLLIGSFVTSAVGVRAPVHPRRTAQDTARRIAAILPPQSTPPRYREQVARMQQLRVQRKRKRVDREEEEAHEKHAKLV